MSCGMRGRGEMLLVLRLVVLRWHCVPVETRATGRVRGGVTPEWGTGRIQRTAHRDTELRRTDRHGRVLRHDSRPTRFEELDCFGVHDLVQTVRALTQRALKP